MKQAALSLEAFSPVCPPVAHVAHALEQLGFRLDFEMAESIPPAYTKLSVLPSQHHFCADVCGTEVIFLAGKDSPEEGEHLPLHASRWWLNAGNDVKHALQVSQVLSSIWPLSWLGLDDVCLEQRTA